jgi:AcrR family transcriptional regulator
MEAEGEPAGAVAGTTRYRSELRTQRAAETRSRIAVAARELFAERGFAGTTIAAIAGRAGVAAPTVYATYGSKGAIVHALLTQFETDADAAGWFARIDAEDDPRRKLALFARWSAALFSSSKAVIAAAQGAASDPAIVELRDQGDRHRRAGLRELLATMAADLRQDLAPEAVLDRAWILTGVELYLAATEGCGWTDDAYADWLTTLLQDQLLRPARAAT